MEPTAMTSSRATSNLKIPIVVLGMLATTALSIPAASAVTAVSANAAWGRGSHAMPESHRLAGGVIKPASLRLV